MVANFAAVTVTAATAKIAVLIQVVTKQMNQAVTFILLPKGILFRPSDLKSGVRDQSQLTRKKVRVVKFKHKHKKNFEMAAAVRLPDTPIRHLQVNTVTMPPRVNRTSLIV